MTDLTKLLSDGQCDPRDLGPALDAATDKEWRDWLPEVLADWYPVRPARANHDKVVAVQVALTNPDVFEDWHLLVPVTAAFCHRTPDFEHFEPPTTAELAWALTCLKSLCPAGHLVGTSLTYVAVAAADDGLLVFPWADDLYVSDIASVRGMYNCDRELSDKVIHGYRSVEGTLPDDIPHDEQDAAEVMLARLLTIRTFVDGKARIPE